MELWILAAVWAVVGTPFVLIARRVFARDHLAAQWPRAPGVITDSSMSSRSARRRDDHGNDIEYTAYSFDVHYTYTVAGRTLQGDRVERERFETDQGGAQRVIDRYPRGRQIEVLYDPNDPTFALLNLPGERPSFGGQDLRTPDERWQLKRGQTYWVRIGKIRRPSPDKPALINARTAPVRVN